MSYPLSNHHHFTTLLYSKARQRLFHLLQWFTYSQNNIRLQFQWSSYSCNSIIPLLFQWQT